MHGDAFSSYNPVINFIFFIGAIVMGMILLHPVYTLCSLVFSFIYYITVKGVSGVRFLACLTGLFVFLSLINPIFNPRGSVVMFSYFGRPYTFEALIYGATLGALVVSVLCWFAAYNAVMSSDKFIYMFARMGPTVSLIVSMTLRLIPNMRRRASGISRARECIGLAGNSSAGRKERIRNGAVTLNILATWGLEDAVVTADSMKARGYGTGKRTNYVEYAWNARNIICAAILIFFLALVAAAAVCGGASADYMPTLDIAWFGNPFMSAGVISYCLFTLTPSFINIREAVRWRILRSGI